MLPTCEAWVGARARGFESTLHRGGLDLLLPDSVRFPGSVELGPRLGAELDRLAADFGRDLGSTPEPGAMRRAMRLAQADAGVHPADALAFLGGPGSKLGQVLPEVLLRVLEAEKSGHRGTEAALLGWSGFVTGLADRLRAAGIERRVLFDLMLRADTAAWLDREPVEGSGRLARALALVPSPVSLGADPDRIAGRLVNNYRTTPAALALARRVIDGASDEPVRLKDAADALAERLLVEDRERDHLDRAVTAERVRDAAIAVSAVQDSLHPGSGAGREAERSSPRPRASAPVADVLRDPRALLAAVAETPRRARLLEALRGLPHPLAQALLQQLEAPPPSEEQRERRAVLAALGALVLRLDERLAARLRAVADRRRPALELEIGRPLLSRARPTEQGVLLLTMHGADLMGPSASVVLETMQAVLLAPARDLAKQQPGVETVPAGPDRVAATGPVDALAVLAFGWQRLRREAEAALHRALPPPIGSEDLPDLLEAAAEDPERGVDALVEASSPPGLLLAVGIGLASGPADRGLSLPWLRASARAEHAQRWAQLGRERRRTGLLSVPPRLVLLTEAPGLVLGEDVLSALRRCPGVDALGDAQAPMLAGLDAKPVRLAPAGPATWVVEGLS